MVFKFAFLDVLMACFRSHCWRNLRGNRAQRCVEPRYSHIPWCLFLFSVFPVGLWPITPSSDIYAVCDLIKTWFRVLPEPAFPSYSYHDIIKAMRKAILTALMTMRLTLLPFSQKLKTSTVG